MPPGILIVDDDPAARAALAGLLRRAGYETAEAADGRQALAWLRASTAAALVVLDLRGLVIDGWQFLAARHREPELSAIPVVVVSAAGSGLRPVALALGADDFLEKPIDPTALLAAVGRFCGRPAPRPGGT
jgi:CheY-like chemotaxis protein